ncbi:MAG TPA: hypothetical protein DCP03_13735 [Polaromonas sp.]|nr:hypothetical protein [Polaromonas sp.]
MGKSVNANIVNSTAKSTGKATPKTSVQKMVEKSVKGKAPQKVVLSMRVPAELKHRLEKEAEASGVSIAELVYPMLAVQGPARGLDSERLVAILMESTAHISQLELAVERQTALLSAALKPAR